MAAEPGGRVFFKLPVRYSAIRADLDEPFVAEPATGTAVQGVADDKFPIAMGGEGGGVAGDFDGSNTVELTASGGPEFDFIDQVEKSYPFPVKSFFYRFCLLVFHCCILTTWANCPVVVAKSPGVAPGCTDLESV